MLKTAEQSLQPLITITINFLKSQNDFVATEKVRLCSAVALCRPLTYVAGVD